MKKILSLFVLLTCIVMGYSEQVVVSIFDSDLENSGNYKLETKSGENYTNFSPSEAIKSITLIGDEKSLDEIIGAKDKNLSKGFLYNDLSTFGTKGSNFTYGTNKGNAIMIPVTKNTENSTTEKHFSRTESYVNQETKEVITTYALEEIFYLPAKFGSISKSDTQTGGVKFTYTDSTGDTAFLEKLRKEYLTIYKNQEYLIRIAKKDSNVKFDIMGKNNAYLPATVADNSDKFFSGTEKYMDFWVSGEKFDKAVNIKSGNDLVELRYIPGNIEIYGLPKGDYELQIYSFRYTKDTTSRGSLIVTEEGITPFSIAKTLAESSVDILSFSTEEFTKIKSKILTVTTTDIDSSKIEIWESKDGIYSDTITTATKITPEIPTEVYINGTKVTLEAGGKYNGLFYKIWDIEFTSKNSQSDSIKRTTKFKVTSDSKEVVTEYILNINTDQVEGYPYQTVFAYYNNSNNWNSPLTISDRNLNPYTKGYKGVKIGNTNNITDFYKGTFTPNVDLVFDENNYNWTGTPSLDNKAIKINKIPSDSKGIFNGGKEFTFYTHKWDNPEIASLSNGDRATITWKSPEKNTYTTLIQDKTIFRIVRNGTTGTKQNLSTDLLPSNYIDGFSGEGLITSDEELDKFLAGTRDFIDLVFDANNDTTIYRDSASFSYASNSLIIAEIPRGNYTIQIYTLQGEDSLAQSSADYDYRVLTYGGASQFTISTSELLDGDFADQNNVYLINNNSYSSTIDPTTNLPVKEITVNFTTKTQEKIPLTIENVKPIKAEFTDVSLQKSTTTGGVYVTEQKAIISSSGAIEGYKGNIEAGKNAKLSTVNTGEFKYPLDIVLCVDNSKSMLNKIQALKSSISDFTNNLEARGYDVKYNLIVFGAPETGSGSLGTTNYKNVVTNKEGELDSKYDGYYFLQQFKKNGNWFDSVNSLESAINELKALNQGTDGKVKSWNYGQENGIYALDRGIKYLSTYGRYLGKDNQPKNHSEYAEGDLESEKMLILLTDENMDTDSLPSGYTKSNAINELSIKIKENKIKFTGIFHTAVATTDTTKYSGLDFDKEDFYYYTKDNKNWWIHKHYDNKVYIGSREASIPYEWLYMKTTGNKTISTYTHDPTEKTKYRFQTSSDEYVVKKASGAYLRIKDRLGTKGIHPADVNDTFYTDFALSTNKLGDSFRMYEAGENAENVKTALLDAVSNVSILQQWELKYQSPFNISDGDFREIIFSLDATSASGNPIQVDTYNTVTKTFEKKDLVLIHDAINSNMRIYQIPETKLESYFVNPNPTTLELTKKDGKIILEALSSSQYRKADGKLYNYQITKGSFIVTDTKGNRKSVTSDDIGTKVELKGETPDSEGRTWYRAKLELDAKEFRETFGKDLVLTVTYIAETNENIKAITLNNVKILDKDPPKIVEIKVTNTGFKSLLESLNTIKSGSFSSEEIKELTERTFSNTEGLKSGDFSKKLPVHWYNSEIAVEFTVDDESIYYENSTLQGSVDLKYLGNSISIDYVSSEGDNLTKWKTTKVINHNSGNSPSAYYPNNLEFICVDKSDNSFETASLLSKETDVFEAINPFSKISYSPVNIASMYNSSSTINYPKLEDSTSEKYPNYYKTNAIQIEENNSNAIGYVLVFSWDKNFSDTTDEEMNKFKINYLGNNGAKGSPIIGTEGDSSNTPRFWLFSRDGKFDLADGKYQFVGQVYAINKAGALLGINDNSSYNPSNIEFFSSLGSNNNEFKDLQDFYIDTVEPKIQSIKLEKISDTNSEINSNTIAKNILIGEIGDSRAFKKDDTIKLSATLIESNTDSIIFSNTDEIFVLGVLEEITTSGDFPNKISSYTREGKAKDFGNEAYFNKDITIKIQDKSGNYIEQSIKAVYDNRIPSALRPKAELTGDGDKRFTSNTKIPLEKVESGNNVPLSTSIIGSYTGNLTGTNYYLTDFKNGGTSYPVQLNQFNSLGTIVSYSYSGVKMENEDTTGNPTGITVDTMINDSTTGFIKDIERGSSDKKYSFNLAEELSKIKELSGLLKFKVVKIPNGIKNVTINNNLYDAEQNLIAANYYSNIPTVSNFTSPYNLAFETDMTGRLPFVVGLWDRLGNYKEIYFEPNIKSSIIIIGKSIGSDKEIKTKVSTDNTIKAREE